MSFILRFISNWPYSIPIYEIRDHFGDILGFSWVSHLYYFMILNKLIKFSSLLSPTLLVSYLPYLSFVHPFNQFAKLIFHLEQSDLFFFSNLVYDKWSVCEILVSMSP